MKTTKTPRAQLGLEKFEDRVTPAVAVNPAGDLVITGNNLANTVNVGYQVIGMDLFYRVNEDGVITLVPAAVVTGGDVYFYGFGGNDYFRNWTSLRTWAYGMDGA